MKQSQLSATTLFKFLPGIHVLISSKNPYKIETYTEEFKTNFRSRANFLGENVIDFFGENLGIEIIKHIKTCLDNNQKQIFHLPASEFSIDIFELTPIINVNGNTESILIRIIQNEKKIDEQSFQSSILERSHQFFSQSNIAMHIFLGPHLELFHANDKSFDLWGKDKSVIGMKLGDYLPELRDQGYLEILEEVFHTGIAYSVSESPVFLPKNGALRLAYVNFSAQPYYCDSLKKPSGVLVMAREITQEVEQRKSNKKLSENLELAIEIGQLGVFNTNLCKKITRFSNEIITWFELNQNEISLTDFYEFVHPEDRVKIIKLFSAVNHQEDEKYNIIFRFITRSKKIVPIKCMAQFHFENGIATHVSGVFQNVEKLLETETYSKERAHVLSQVLKNAPFPIGLYKGKDMRIEFVNDAIIHTWGKGTDLLGKKYAEILPELQDQNVYNQLNDVFESGKPFIAKNQFIKLAVNGQLKDFYFNYTFTPIYNLEGKIYGVMNTANDVTDLVIAKQKAEESENRYRLLIEESSVATALYIGQNHKIQYANDLMLKFWGKDQQIIGSSIREALPELKGQNFFEKFDRVFKTGEDYVGIGEEAWLEVNGVMTRGYYNFTYKALRNQANEIYGIHHIAIDSTQEKLNLEALHESEKNFRNMILQAPIAICILTGKDYRFEIINQKMEFLLGRTSDKLLNYPLFEAMPELANEGLQAILKKVFESGKSYISEEQNFHLPRPNGLQSLYVTYIYEPVLDQNNMVKSVMVVANDVTQQVLSRKKIEEIVQERTKELADANLSLKNSNAELAQFAYIASHDLQEPLRKITIFGNMLEENLGEISPKAKAYLEKITSSATRMTNLIKDVLGYSQLSHGKDIFKKADLNKILKEVINDYELIIEQKKVRISWNNLPVIKVIPLQISQLFSNLISNSIKYSRENVPPEIIIEVAQTTDLEYKSYHLLEKKAYFKFTFTDNGIGFKPEYSEKIFSIFQRLHGKGEFEGTGIGLAMCKKIVENHNGVIFAAPSQDFGASFIFFLPEK
ncbi:PAS domain-containing protein [Flavobacterium sp. NST-5]|uniref:histidine kinase n=1 Tax=Flavobacterium ichthyis TaxID=2698827 RepID=A0ABW9Z7N2_9FLAO|nr:PAS domain-containing protein [Flavobacterium ichthyis]NBL64115.1 PAS domain-containing protein [Flavobacterium ichthyis]